MGAKHRTRFLLSIKPLISFINVDSKAGKRCSFNGVRRAGIVQLPNDSFYNTGIATYVWIINKDKPEHRKGKVQLIDASKCFLARRKPIGSKRHDIAEASRSLIVQAYGEFQTKTYEGIESDGKPIVCKSKIVDGISLGYSKVVVESPVRNEDGKQIFLPWISFVIIKKILVFLTVIVRQVWRQIICLTIPFVLIKK